MIEPTESKAPTFILLASWNGARFLPALLHSIEAQSDPRWRVLARDDDSSDETPALLARWAQSDPRVTLVQDGRGRLGSSAGFILLMEYAIEMGAEYFALCDQDDVWHPEKLELLRDRIEEIERSSGGAKPALVWSDLGWIDEHGKRIADSHFQTVGGERVRQGLGAWLLSMNLLPGCAMLGNRLLLDKICGLGCRPVHHDWWVALVAGAFGVTAMVDRPLADYRQHSENQIGAKRFEQRLCEFTREPERVLRRAWITYWQAVDLAYALASCSCSEQKNDQWEYWIHHVLTELGSKDRLTRASAVLYGPVRRPGVSRSALMLIAAIMRAPADSRSSC